MTCTDQVLLYANIGASALLLVGIILRFVHCSKEFNLFFLLGTLYLLFFDIVLLVGLMGSQGYGLESNFLNTLRLQFFLITTTFGRGLLILLSSFLLLESDGAGELILAIICIIIAIVDLAIGLKEDSSV